MIKVGDVVRLKSLSTLARNYEVRLYPESWSIDTPFVLTQKMSQELPAQFVVTSIDKVGCVEGHGTHWTVHTEMLDVVTTNPAVVKNRLGKKAIGMEVVFNGGGRSPEFGRFDSNPEWAGKEAIIFSYDTTDDTYLLKVKLGKDVRALWWAYPSAIGFPPNTDDED